MTAESPTQPAPRRRVHRFDWFGKYGARGVTEAQAYQFSARIGKIFGLNADGVRVLRGQMREAALRAKREMLWDIDYRWNSRR